MRNKIEDAMRTTVLYLTVLSYAFANPNGYYHQEYNYKTSSSAYRNNELQHQTDDQGYYRKDGDLEGRHRPKVDANSEHSEYVNPNLRTSDYSTGLVGGANGDLSSYGHMRANMGSYNSLDQSAESLAHSDRISGNQGAYSGYSSGSYGSSYGRGSQSYSMASSLQTVTSRLQQELERELQRAIYENRAYSDLEREIRQNLTNRLDTELMNTYGQQSIRGGLSYSLSGGRLHSTANYDNQELLDLRRNLENSLLQQLRTRYNQAYSNSNRYTYSTTTNRPYYPQYVTTYRPFTTVRPQYIDHTNYVSYAPIENRESITTVASRVQNQLDARLNQILEDVQRTHFSSGSSYGNANTEVLLERLRNELRSNISYFLEEEIRRSYGTQIQRDGQVYIVGAGGQTSNQHNYSVRDLENLRNQIERNLIEKLNRDFERYRASWYQQYRQSGLTSQNSYREYSTTPRYVQYTTPYTPRYDVYTPQYGGYERDAEQLSNRPSSNHITSLISGAGESSSRNHYVVSGAGQSGYEVSGTRGVSQLQRQLQQDLSRQLQAALNRGHFGYYSGSYNPQSYQTSLQQLSDELNRNLTRQLQEYSSSSYYSTYGNIDQAQLASLRNQLQADLMQQLQQGLQQSYHASSSYSASSSSSSSAAGYRAARGFQNYQQGQYRNGGNVVLTPGDDCVGDDPNAYISHRMKRSYQPYRSQPVGLSQSGYGRYGGYNSNGNQHQQQLEQGQEIDDSDDLTQQVEDLEYKNLELQNQNKLRQEEDSDLTQQTEDLQLGSQRQKKLSERDDSTQQIENDSLERIRLGSEQSQQQSASGQQEDDDLTQQVEDDKFGKIQLGSQQTQQQIEQGQQEDNSDLTQQIQDNKHGKLQLGSQQNQIEEGQEEDNSDLTQQVEDDRFGKLQIGSQQSQRQTGTGQEEDNSDLTQQVEDDRFGKLQIGSQQNQKQTETGQEEENSDLTQQVEDDRFGKLQVGSQQSSQWPTGTGQEEDNSDLTQQVEDDRFGKLQTGSQQSQRQAGTGQEEDNSDLTQQVEDDRFGKLQTGSQQSQSPTETGQEEDNSDLTQQVEDDNFGKLQLGSQQGQQQIETGQREDNSDLTQQTINRGYHQLNFGSHQRQQTGQAQQGYNPDLSQQNVDSGFGRIQQGSRQSQQQSALGQQEDNSDLTQQVEDSHLGQIQWGSQQNSRPTSDLYQQQEDITGRALQSGSQTQVRGDQTQTQQTNQVELTEQLKEDLSKQLKKAIQEKLYASSYSSSNNYQFQRLYYNLNNELRRNITRQIQAIASSSSTSSSFSRFSKFSNQELNDVQRKLDRDLNLELQEKLNSINRNNVFNSEQQQRQYLGQPGQSDLTQQVEAFDLPQNNVRNPHQPLNQIQEYISSQIRNAVKTKYSQRTDISSSLQIYQELVNELRNNITTELLTNGYTGQQLVKLKNQLENDLKVQLDRDISLYEQQSTQYVQNIEVTDNLSPGAQQVVQQESIPTDLTQQVEDSKLGSYHDDDLSQQTVGQGRIQFGNQPSNSLGHQSNNGFPQQFQRPSTVPQSNGLGFNQGRDTSISNQDHLDLNHQVEYEYQPGPVDIPSANLQLGGRPVTRRPISSNQFIQTEVDQQKQLNPVDTNSQINANPLRLPTLNQVIQQNQTPNNEEFETPNIVEPLDPDFSQQVDSNKREDTRSTNVEQTTSTYGSRVVPTNVNNQEPQPIVGGPATRFTNQGQLYTHPQSVSDAEREADILIQRLREHRRNNLNQQNLNQNPSQQTISQNQQEVYSTEYNNIQKRLVERLKYKLSEDLKKAITDESAFAQISSSTGQQSLNQLSYQRLVDRLQKNINNQLQELEKNSFIYDTFSSEQKIKLQENLQREFQSQLERDLISRGLTQTSVQDSGTYTPAVEYGYGPRPNQVYTPYQPAVSYGQQGQIGQNFETTSDLKPLVYQQANPVQDVSSQVAPNNNIGVKGRRYRVNSQVSSPQYGVPQPPQSVVPPPSQPAVIVPPGDVAEVPPPPPQPGDISPETASETPEITEENASWWKRFGNKVKQGAQTFKEKYIG